MLMPGCRVRIDPHVHARMCIADSSRRRSRRARCPPGALAAARLARAAGSGVPSGRNSQTPHNVHRTLGAALGRATHFTASTRLFRPHRRAAAARCSYLLAAS
eukprot:COSAG01_NODE_12_length_41732_cov_160.472964_2_plen_103_part_00